jgi:hypothetical protein
LQAVAVQAAALVTTAAAVVLVVLGLELLSLSALHLQ